MKCLAIFNMLMWSFLASDTHLSSQDIFSDALSRSIATLSRHDLCSQERSSCKVFVEKPLGKTLQELKNMNGIEFIQYDSFENTFLDEDIALIARFLDLSFVQNKVELFISIHSFNASNRTLSYIYSFRLIYIFNNRQNKFIFHNLKRASL